jgi:starvation-inducible DNA-binding protein
MDEAICTGFAHPARVSRRENVMNKLDEAVEMTFPASDPVSLSVTPERGAPRTMAYPTKNDLPEDSRVKVAALLNARLAETIDLQLQAKQAHWNVKGPLFQQLHELFDQVHAVAVASTDLIAERAVQLGAVAAGTVQAVAERTTLKVYPTEASDGLAHVDLVSSALADVAAKARAAIDESAGLGDQATADVFTEITRSLDKQLWMVEAHQQREPTR